jgi:hypothetical protein
MSICAEWFHQIWVSVKNFVSRQAPGVVAHAPRHILWCLGIRARISSQLMVSPTPSCTHWIQQLTVVAQVCSTITFHVNMCWVYLSDLSIGQKLCLSGGSGGSGCTQYTVVSGDTCSHIESTHGISDAQLHAQNPAINSGCTSAFPFQLFNLNMSWVFFLDLQIGQKLCVWISCHQANTWITCCT